MTKDKSAYWSAALYFQDGMGQLTIVPEVSHLTYYKYTPVTLPNGKYTFPSAMPNGFKMISGDPYQRNFTLPVPDPPRPWTGADVTQSALAQKAIGFNCLNYAKAPEASLFRHFLPDKAYIDANCADGLRLELLFPQCWDGKNLESSDFKSHVAFPDSSINGGRCPDGYDSVINQLFFETIVDTGKFKGQAGQFVLSDGDPTGYGYHGDVIIAWEDNMLDDATKTCGPDLEPTDAGFSGQTTDCPVFQPVLNDQAAMQTCSIATPAALKNDILAGPATKLPGNVEIQSGPGYAAPAGGKPAATPTPPPASSPQSKPSLPYSAGSSGSAPEDGNVFLQQASSTASATSAPSPPPPAPTTTATSSLTAAPLSPPPPAPAAPASSSSPAPPPSAPATTPAPAAPPAAPAPVGLQLTTVTTSYYTQGREAYEVVVVAEEVTITVDGSVPAAAAATPAKRDGRRHEHAAHARRHAHHWRGGRI